MITDTCTCHTRLDTLAHTRYLYEHELGYSMEYYHAIGTRGGTTARSHTHFAPNTPCSCPASAHRKYLLSHRSCTYFAQNTHLEYRRSRSTGNHIEVSGNRHPKCTNTSGKYELGTDVTNAVLYTSDTEIHTKSSTDTTEEPRRRRRSTGWY